MRHLTPIVKNALIKILHATGKLSIYLLDGSIKISIKGMRLLWSLLKMGAKATYNYINKNKDLWISFIDVNIIQGAQQMTYGACLTLSNIYRNSNNNNC